MTEYSPLKAKRLFLFDLDGTLYLGDNLFPGARELLAFIRTRGGQYRFLTNNSSRSVDAYVQKLSRLGIAAQPRDFLTSVDAMAAHLHAHGMETRRFYVCGTESMKSQLRAAGFTVAERREDADALLMGFDTELTFQKLEDACILLNRGAEFWATNPDWVCPTWYGSVPDCGSVCRMLTTATGRTPRFLGKPQPDMAVLAMARTGFAPEQTVLLGDRLYTDIACGAGAGIDTVFVLSGEGTEADIEKFGVQPTWVRRDIAALLQELEDN